MKNSANNILMFPSLNTCEPHENLANHIMENVLYNMIANDPSFSVKDYENDVLLIFNSIRSCLLRRNGKAHPLQNISDRIHQIGY